MRVVIAEDLVLLRDGIARTLSGFGFDVVAQVGDAAALLDAVVALRPDLAVVDVRMPPDFVDEGARATLLLRERYPELGVLVLSHTIDPLLAVTLAGERPTGFGYLLKDRVLDIGDFVAAVRLVASGGTVIDQQVIDYYLGENATRLQSLSPRELDVLRHLAQGMSNAGIAAALFLSERTVDAHLRSIFVKLRLVQSTDDNRRVQAALLWLQNG